MLHDIIGLFISFIQSEDNVDLQTRSATAVASFIEFCVRHHIAQPPDKIIKNLCTFLCQDVEHTPTFAFTCPTTEGILSFKSPRKSSPSRNGKEAKSQAESDKTDEYTKTFISRRGACLAWRFRGSASLHDTPRALL